MGRLEPFREGQLLRSPMNVTKWRTAPIAVLSARAEISNLLSVPLQSAPEALQCASSHRALRLWRAAWEKDHA
jgi:hypothetical protein